jgi:hypothetical protein
VLHTSLSCIQFLCIENLYVVPWHRPTTQQMFLPAAGLTWEQRCLQLHEGALWAMRLLGNLRHTPGPLPSHAHGYPTSLLLAIANTPAALLHAAASSRNGCSSTCAALARTLLRACSPACTAYWARVWMGQHCRCAGFGSSGRQARRGNDTSGLAGASGAAP